jgi:hypothetical protein
MHRLRAVLLVAGLAAPAPTQTPLPPPPARDYDAHVAALRPRLPHERFTIVVQPPFVVAGDEAPAVVRRRAERTVKWAVDLLRKEFFDEDPEAIIDVWLFANRASYEKHTRVLFGERPTTPFGFYSAKHRALVMNGADRDFDRGVLRRRSRHQLRSGSLPVLLAAGERAAAALLPRLPARPPRRPDRPCDAAHGAR